MGEIQPCPGESDGGDQAGGWDKELRAWGCAEVGGSQGRSRTSQVGSDRAGFPEAPRPTTPPPQAVESRGSGLRDSPAPCSPRAQEFHQPGRGACFGLSPSWLPLDQELQLFLGPSTPTQATGLPPAPSPPLPWLARCVPGAGRKQTRRGGFAGSGVTLTQLRQSLMADTHSACSGGTVAVARKPAAA